jgi:hypothetical protein
MTETQTRSNKPLRGVTLIGNRITASSKKKKKTQQVRYLQLNRQRMYVGCARLGCVYTRPDLLQAMCTSTNPQKIEKQEIKHWQGVLVLRTGIS